jgi:hypothetical protein
VSPSASVRGPGDLAASAAGGGSPSFRSYTKGLSAEDQVDKPAASTSQSRNSGGGGIESRPLPTPPSLVGSGQLQQQQQHMALLDSAAQKLGAVGELTAGSRSASSASESWGGSSASTGGSGGTKVASIKRSESAKDGNKRAQPRPYQRCVMI